MATGSQQVSCHVIGRHVWRFFYGFAVECWFRKETTGNSNLTEISFDHNVWLDDASSWWFFRRLISLFIDFSDELWPIFKTPLWKICVAGAAIGYLKPRGWYNILKNLLLSGWKTRFPTCWWVWWTDDYSMLMGDWAAGGFHEWNISNSRDNFGLKRITFQFYKIGLGGRRGQFQSSFRTIGRTYDLKSEKYLFKWYIYRFTP